MNVNNGVVEQHRKQRIEENAIDLDNFDHQNDFAIENLIPEDEQV